jgi:hypothetical protein
MFKVMALIVSGIILMGIGVYALSKAQFPAFNLQFLNLDFLFQWANGLQSANWTMIGFVGIFGSIAVFGSAVVVTKILR